MPQVNVRARQALEYHHTYEENGEEKEFTLRFLGDVPGIVRWLAPNSEGRQQEPGADNFDEFLRLVVDPSDSDKLDKVIEKGRFGESARYDAAKMAWRNAAGIVDFMTVAAKVKRLEDLADSMELQIEKAQSGEDDKEEDAENPTDD